MIQLLASLRKADHRHLFTSLRFSHHLHPHPRQFESSSLSLSVFLFALFLLLRSPGSPLSSRYRSLLLLLFSSSFLLYNFSFSFLLLLLFFFSFVFFVSDHLHWELHSAPSQFKPSTVIAVRPLVSRSLLCLPRITNITLTNSGGD